MKQMLLTTLVIFILSILISNDAFAQNGYGRRANDKCINDFNLTDAQKDQFSQLRNEHRENMIKLHSEIELMELELDKIKDAKDFSREMYLIAVKDISTVRNKLSEARAEHRMDIYEMLDDTQKKEFLSKGDNFNRGQCKGNFHKRGFRRS